MLINERIVEHDWHEELLALTFLHDNSIPPVPDEEPLEDEDIVVTDLTWRHEMSEDLSDYDEMDPR